MVSVIKFSVMKTLTNALERQGWGNCTLFRFLKFRMYSSLGYGKEKKTKLYVLRPMIPVGHWRLCSCSLSVGAGDRSISSYLWNSMLLSLVPAAAINLAATWFLRRLMAV
jgi:hypothetical protein